MRVPECCGTGFCALRMWDGVMKFAYAWTFAGEPRDETPAPPPGKRAPALPRLPCRALFRQAGKCIFQTGKRIFRAMLAVFRTGCRQRLAFGEHVPGPGLHLAAQPKRRNRRLSYPPHRERHALEICIGQRLPHGSRRPACEGRIGPPHPNQKLVRIYRMAGCAPQHPTLRPQTKRERHKSPAIPWTEPGTFAWAITNIGATAGTTGC